MATLFAILTIKGQHNNFEGVTVTEHHGTLETALVAAQSHTRKGGVALVLRPDAVVLDGDHVVLRSDGDAS